jgi:uncharacterized membrane protein SpoIIM required for sporulation
VKSVIFRRERESTWRELAELVHSIERTGLVGLTPAQASRLPVVYRATLSSLSVARAISLDANLLSYLESLSARAYVATYGSKRRPWDAVRDLVLDRFPAAVRDARRQVALASTVLLLGAVTGHLLTLHDPAHFYAFVSEALADGRGPSSTTSELRAVLYSSRDAADLLTAFAMFLFTHNAAVGMLCFATGFAAGVPTLLLLFGNGLVLGAFGGLYSERGLGLEFWGWVLPHGVTELLAVILCGAAGLALGDALLFPGRHTRLSSVAARGREAGVIVAGSVLLFFVAGLVEGVFRQTVHDLVARWSVAALSMAGWLLYFTRGLQGRR